MASNTTDYQIPLRWYRITWLIVTLCNAWLAAVFFVAEYVIPSIGLPVTAQDGHSVLVLSAINLAYLLLAYWLFAKRNVALASFVGAMLTVFSTYLAAATALTITPLSLAHVTIWGGVVWLMGMYGNTVSVSIAVVSIMAQLVARSFMVSHIPFIFWIFVAITLVAVVVNHYFWRGRFQVTRDQEFDKLSGLLRTNKQESEVIIRSIADGVIVIDNEGKINIINPAAAEMTEWSVEEATGVDAQLVVKFLQENGKELEESTNPFRLALNQKKYITQTLELHGRKGKQAVVSLVISPVFIPETNQLAGFVAVMRDISEAHAEEQQRADFISTASHEMRTPVAAIEGYLALALNDRVSTIDSRARGFLEKAHTSTQHLGKLFQDLLTSAKAEDGRLSSHPIVVEMGEFLQQLSDDLGFAAKKKGLATEFVVGSSQTIDATNSDDPTKQHVLKPLYYTYADPERLREVITNLFDNAVKYTDEGKISLGLTGDNEVVQLYIRDTGPGIPAEDIPHLFQKFYRVDNSATRTIGGTGLGLFISRKIIELYKGRIWVESSEGRGSTFFINLPRLDTQKAAQLQANESNQPGGSLPNTTSLTNS